MVFGLHFYCDFSHFHVVYPMQEKSEYNLISCCDDFVGLARSFEYNVNTMQSDHDAAASFSYEQWTSNKGIRITKSAPYTPSQNGTAESAGYRLIRRARALRLASNLSHKLWSEIVKTAAYLENRTLTRSLEWRTFYEIITKNTFYIEHIQTLSSKIFFLKNNILKSLKLNSRAT